jgi:hypothetical protein
MTTETKNWILNSLIAANAEPYTPARPSGCGRAYVSVCGDRATINAVSAACKKLGLMFLRKAHGTCGNVIYIGYDNCDGRALAKSEAFAKVLNERGIRAYTEAVGD